jgi:hypothetical protein
MVHRIRLLAVILAGFALRLVGLGIDSLWYDETVSAYLARQPVPELIAHTARDIHPPGYYLLLHFWSTVAGSLEFALAFFSVVCGLLLVALTYRFARTFINRPTAAWAALLAALSPFHLWYSQEVRMYTLGALLGLAAAYCALAALKTRHPAWRWLAGYAALAAAGMYTLYYLAFLLVPLNLLLLTRTLWPKINRPALTALLTANLLALAAYLPWLPIAWRQAVSPPVPPWRAADALRLWSMLLESWSALSLGQSVEPAEVWPALLLTLALFGLGLVRLARGGHKFTALLLVLYTFGPLLLIYLISLIIPLYHVRYIFTYAPAFYMVLAAGFTWPTRRRARVWPLLALVGLLAGSAVSITRYHTHPLYRADDFRAAVAFIDRHWQPGDAILVNAGYVYTAFDTYTTLPYRPRRLVPYQSPQTAGLPYLLQTGTLNGSPQLGWGNPRADFYAMSQTDTAAALPQLGRDFARLWVLRAYDTVTDPPAFIRGWLAANATPLEDQPFNGPSNIRVQGFLLPGAPPPPAGQTPALFADGLALFGWLLPDQPWQAGQTIPVRLWWAVTAPPGAAYKMSLKLWTPAGQLAAQGQDTWPVGSLYRATNWPPHRPVYQPVGLPLPAGLPPGEYWLNVELYHPNTVQPLPRLDFDQPAVTLGQVVVQ